MEMGIKNPLEDACLYKPEAFWEMFLRMKIYIWNNNIRTSEILILECFFTHLRSNKIFCLLWFCSFILLFSVWHNSISKSYKMYGWHSNFINLVGFGWAYYVPNFFKILECELLSRECFCWKIFCFGFSNSQVCQN